MQHTLSLKSDIYKKLGIISKKMTFQAKTVGFKPGERNVFFHILTACNLSCNHCYINKEQHGNDTLDKQTIEEWLKLFYEPKKKSNLILLGGEPTLHPYLAEIITFAKDLGFYVTVDSNGYLFHDLLEKTTPKQLDYLSFSLDGPNAEVNDAIRGEGVFSTCVANITEAVKKGFRVSVIYTVSKKNIEYLHHMVPLLKKLKIDRFFIQVIGLRGESTNSKAEELQVTKKQWLNVVPTVAQKCAEENIHVIYPKVFLEEQEEFECAGLVAENYFIFPNGRVYLCPLCEDYELHTYEIKENVLVERKAINEKMLFSLDIAEGCVMNKLLQPETIEYNETGKPTNKISCCLLKQEIANSPDRCKG